VIIITTMLTLSGDVVVCYNSVYIV